MWEAALPVLRGVTRLPDHPTAPSRNTELNHEVDRRAESLAWRQGRIEAFTLLDDARLLQSYRLATLILRDRDEAEDATQEAIVRAWSSWWALRDRSRFDAWFDRILVNVCRNRLRHARTIRVVTLDDSFQNPAADSHAATIARLTLEPAFARLSPDQ
jgi:DNA-directed RNA polymerase specialized sigma24 family protein